MFSKRLFLKSIFLIIGSFFIKKNLNFFGDNKVVYLNDKKCTWILSKNDFI